MPLPTCRSKPLLIQDSHVRREAEWWEFHRDKPTAIVSLPYFVQQLSLAQAVLLKEHCSQPLSTVSAEREDLLLRLPGAETNSGLRNFQLCQIFNVLDIFKKKKGFSQNLQCDVCFISVSLGATFSLSSPPSSAHEFASDQRSQTLFTLHYDIVSSLSQ